jgi:hypothetical protein
MASRCVPPESPEAESVAVPELVDRFDTVAAIGELAAGSIVAEMADSPTEDGQAIGSEKPPALVALAAAAFEKESVTLALCGAPALIVVEAEPEAICVVASCVLALQ